MSGPTTPTLAAALGSSYTVLSSTEQAPIPPAIPPTPVPAPLLATPPAAVPAVVAPPEEEEEEDDEPPPPPPPPPPPGTLEEEEAAVAAAEAQAQAAKEAPVGKDAASVDEAAEGAASALRDGDGGGAPAPDGTEAHTTEAKQPRKRRQWEPIEAAPESTSELPEPPEKADKASSDREEEREPHDGRLGEDYTRRYDRYVERGAGRHDGRRDQDRRDQDRRDRYDDRERRPFKRGRSPPRAGSPRRERDDRSSWWRCVACNWSNRPGFSTCGGGHARCTKKLLPLGYSLPRQRANGRRTVGSGERQQWRQQR